MGTGDERLGDERRKIWRQKTKDLETKDKRLGDERQKTWRRKTKDFKTKDYKTKDLQISRLDSFELIEHSFERIELIEFSLTTKSRVKENANPE